jgi:hypothetical protein
LINFEEAAGMFEEHGRMRSMEQARYHLARAESEVEAAQRFLDPSSSDEEEKAVVRAAVNARTCLGDALETLRARFW